MTELKIRVWDNLFKEFKAFDNYFCRAKNGILTVRTNNDDITLDLPTGLKDKNGKEIYKGDIVRWVDDYDENAYIDFDEGCFWVNWPINSERINGDMVDDLEVIGNIHENPELLEEEE